MTTKFPRTSFAQTLVTLGILAFPMGASAVVVTVAQFHLGEAGSLGGLNQPLDSVVTGTPAGAQDYVSEINGGSGVTTGSASLFAPGSTAYLDTSNSTNSGWYGADFSGLQTDNFALGVFARAAALGTNIGDVFTVGGGNGAYKLSLDANGWAASAHNVTWISNPNGNAGTFAPDTWVHLALIRQSGTATFYINGVAANTSTTAAVNGAAHMSVSPGGALYFDGLIDEARVVTFDPSDSATSILNALQGVPEPSSSAAFLVVGFVATLRRGRR